VHAADVARGVKEVVLAKLNSAALRSNDKGAALSVVCPAVVEESRHAAPSTAATATRWTMGRVQRRGIDPPEVSVSFGTIFAPARDGSAARV